MKKLAALLSACLLSACAATPGRSGGEFVIDRHEVLILESFPMQLQLSLTGQLPDACHQVEWEVADPGESGRIEISVFAVALQDDCAGGPEPFSLSIGLGSFTSGEFSIWLNGDLISQVDLGDPPPDPGAGVGSDDPTPTPEPTVDTTGWKRGAVFLESTEIVMLESYPVQVRLLVRGSLPTPCHRLFWEAIDLKDRIEIELYSLSDPEVECIQVLQGFEESIPLGSYTSGEMEVWINGEPVTSFEV